MNDFLPLFARRFAALDAGSLDRLAQLYTEDIRFRDPLHQVHGLPALRNYFAALYANVQDLQFDFHSFEQSAAGAGYLRWTMRYRHPRLRGGAPIEVDGCSYLRWSQGRVYLHRDYFDAGALLYEHLPVLGTLIGWLKRRLS